jgi:predicted metal-binding membrane protein
LDYLQRTYESRTLDARTASGDNRTLLGVSALLFAVAVAATVYLCQSMSGGMLMPGGWTMSMAWMQMPGQNWVGSAAAFVGMWVIMMVGMMLPSLVPSLLRYRRVLPGNAPVSWFTALVAAGYFFVWTLLGAFIYPLGVFVAKAEMQSPPLARGAPVATGVMLLLAGAIQLTPWKARQLGRCMAVPVCGQAEPLKAISAWNHGVRLGTACILCCSCLTAVLVVTGVMNLVAMVLVAAAITAERVLPEPLGQHMRRRSF